MFELADSIPLDISKAPINVLLPASSFSRFSLPSLGSKFALESGVMVSATCLCEAISVRFALDPAKYRSTLLLFPSSTTFRLYCRAVVPGGIDISMPATIASSLWRVYGSGHCMPCVRRNCTHPVDGLMGVKFKVDCQGWSSARIEGIPFKVRDVGVQVWGRMSTAFLSILSQASVIRGWKCRFFTFRVLVHTLHLSPLSFPTLSQTLPSICSSGFRVQGSGLGIRA